MHFHVKWLFVLYSWFTYQNWKSGKLRCKLTYSFNASSTTWFSILNHIQVTLLLIWTCYIKDNWCFPRIHLRYQTFWKNITLQQWVATLIFFKLIKTIQLWYIGKEWKKASSSLWHLVMCANKINIKLCLQ